MGFQITEDLFFKEASDEDKDYFDDNNPGVERERRWTHRQFFDSNEATDPPDACVSKKKTTEERKVRKVSFQLNSIAQRTNGS